MRAYTLYIILFLICIIWHQIQQARHPFRTPDPTAAQVTISCKGYKTYTLASHRLRPYPLFTFHINDIKKHLIPNKPIPYRNELKKSVQGKQLSEITQQIVADVIQERKRVRRKKAKRNYVVIRDKNFNYDQLHGLVIFKLKNHPFVIKLFMETPQTFFDFRSTGFESPFFFYMGGGANRFLTGLTRIQNRNLVEETINQLPRWKGHIEIPRKWFWIPEKSHDLHLVGKNIGGHPEIQTTLPRTYAIIEDAIDLKNETITMAKQIKKHMILDLCNDLNIYIDPHPHNHVFIQDKKNKQFKIALVDTEHFPTMAGMFQKVYFKNHKRWYTFLASQYVSRMYLQTKRDIMALQTAPNELAVHIPILKNH